MFRHLCSSAAVTAIYTFRIRLPSFTMVNGFFIYIFLTFSKSVL